MVSTTTDTEGDDVVTAKPIARRYKTTDRAVYIWAKKGIIPSFRIGGKTIRFRMSEVIAALEGGAK